MGDSVAIMACTLLECNDVRILRLFDSFKDICEPLPVDGPHLIKQVDGIKHAQGRLQPVEGFYTKFGKRGPGNSKYVYKLLKDVVKYPKEKIKGIISEDNVKVVFESYINQSERLINIIEDPVRYAYSYNTPYASEWVDDTLMVSAENAMYWDATSIIMQLPDKQVNAMYQDLMNVTGYSIKYIGVDSRDIGDIFPVISYSADKGIWYLTRNEDDYLVGEEGNKKSLYYETMAYKIFSEKNLTFFKLVYNTDSIKVVEYIGR